MEPKSFKLYQTSSKINQNMMSTNAGFSDTLSTNSSGLGQDNEILRQKLHELREEKSRLITENHELQSELEATKYELHQSSLKFQSLDDTMSKYKHKIQELIDAIDCFQRSSEKHQKSAKEFESLYSECNSRLQESRNETQLLFEELTDLKQLKKQTEAERDFALDSAEKIQNSFQEFKNRVIEKLQSAESQLESICLERNRLSDDLDAANSQIVKLKEDSNNLNRELKTEKEIRTDLEKQNADLIDQIKKYNPQISKLEQDLKNNEQLKKENKRLRTVCEEQKKKLDQSESEIRENQTQMSHLEILVQKLQQGISKNSHLFREFSSKEKFNFPECKETSGGSKGDLFIIKNNDEVDDLKLKLAVSEKELEHFKAKLFNSPEVGCSSFDDKNFTELESLLKKLEEERIRHLSTIGGLERKVSDLEVGYASLDAQLNQRNLQIADLQKEVNERAVKEMAIDRDLRKRSIQVTSLEKQLDEKTADLTLLMANTSEMNEELENKSSQVRALDEELQEKDQQLSLNQSELETRKNVEHELREKLTSLEKQYQEAKSELSMTEERCKSLQKSLNDIIVVTNSLKMEVEQSNEHMQVMVASYDEQLSMGSDRIRHLEAELSISREALDSQNVKLEKMICEQDTDIQSREQQIRTLEEKIEKITEELEDKTDEIEGLEKDLQERQMMLKESTSRIEELEHLQSTLQEQVSQVQQEMHKETEKLKALLETSEKKLNQACMNVERREEQVKEMMKTIRDLQFEKKKVVDDLGSQLKDSLKELKQAKKDLEKQVAVITNLKNENSRITTRLKESEENVEDFKERLSSLNVDLEEKREKVNELYVDVERLKSEVQMKDARLMESEKNFESQGIDLRRCQEQLDVVKDALQRNQIEVQSRKNESDELNELLQERQWDLQQRAAQVTQLEMAMKECLSQSEQKLIRLEGSLKKSHLEAQQRATRIADLENQTGQLHAALQEKSMQFHQSEHVNQQLKCEIESRSSKMSELERVNDGLKQEIQDLRFALEHAEGQLRTSRDHLEKIQRELSDSRQELMLTRTEHDGLARDFSDATQLLQSKETELSNLLQISRDIENDRAMFNAKQRQIENEIMEEREKHCKDLAALKSCHEATVAILEEENHTLKQKLTNFEEKQRQFTQELKRSTEELSSTRVELEASRTIVGASKETLYIKDAEIARLQARIGSLMRSAHQLPPSKFQNSIEHNPSDDQHIVAPPADLSAISDASSDIRFQYNSSGGRNKEMTIPSRDGDSESKSHVPPTKKVSVNFQTADNCVRSLEGTNHSRNSTVAPRRDCSELLKSVDHLLESYSIQDMEDDNPDSLQAMWKQLQLASSIQQQTNASSQLHGSASSEIEWFKPDSALNPSSYESGDLCLPGNGFPSKRTTETGDPRKGSEVSRSGGIFEEKQRIQNRIKALIGFKEPKQPSKPNSKKLPNRTTGASRKNAKQERSPGSVSSRSLDTSTAVSYYASENMDRRFDAAASLSDCSSSPVHSECSDLGRIL